MIVKVAGSKIVLSLFSIIVLCASLLAQEGTDGQRDSVFLKQSHAPITAVSQSDAAVVLKNVSDKTVKGYTLACFKKRGRSYGPIALFSDSKVAMDPGKTLFEGGYDAYPVPRACTMRSSLVGVAQVTFSDDSTWKSPLMRDAPADLERINLPD